MPPPYSPPATLSGLMLATRPERRASNEPAATRPPRRYARETVPESGSVCGLRAAVDFLAVEAQRPNGRLAADADDFRFWSGVERGVDLYAAPCALVLAVDQSHGVSKPKSALLHRPYTSPDRVIRGRRKRYAAPSRAPAACWPADNTASIKVNDGDTSGLRSPMTTYAMRGDRARCCSQGRW